MLKLGNLAAHVQPDIHIKIKSRIGNPVQFDSLMVEIYVWAWHQMHKGRTVVPLEQADFPDLRVVGDGFEHPVFFECKRLRSTSQNRIESDIKDGSRQLGQVPEPAYKVLVLDVTESVGAIRTELRPPPNPDPVPEPVLAIATSVREALQPNKNKSVELVIIVWDDYVEKGSPEQKGTFWVLRRRTDTLIHPAHHEKVKMPESFFGGFSVAGWVLWQPRLA